MPIKIVYADTFAGDDSDDDRSSCGHPSPERRHSPQQSARIRTGQLSQTTPTFGSAPTPDLPPPIQLSATFDAFRELSGKGIVSALIQASISMHDVSLYGQLDFFFFSLTMYVHRGSVGSSAR